MYSAVECTNPTESLEKAYNRDARANPLVYLLRLPAVGCLPPAVAAFQVMENDVVAAVKAGAHGVVIGVGE